MLTTQSTFPTRPRLTGFDPPDGNGEPATGVRAPVAAILKTAIVSEPPLTAKRKLFDGSVMISWSESYGPRLNEGLTPSPPVGNGEPGSTVKLPLGCLR